MRNKIDGDGMAALAEAIRAGAMPKLKPKGLQLGFNKAPKGAVSDVLVAMKTRGKAAASPSPG